MNIKDDISSHRYGAREFYRLLHATTIAEAAKEPLKLRNLSSISPAISGTARQGCSFFHYAGIIPAQPAGLNLRSLLALRALAPLSIINCQLSILLNILLTPSLPSPYPLYSQLSILSCQLHRSGVLPLLRPRTLAGRTHHAHPVRPSAQKVRHKKGR